ncbi:MAG TPA: TatD family deoxyribonuclease [Desulfonatronum sp.]|nr:TatD family deoxyribonuclease [Desulfonatronum sp.]
MASKKKPEPQCFHLPPVGVETHAHLDLPEFAGDLNQVLERARQASIVWIGNIFLSVKAYKKHRPALAQSPGLFFTLGVHPHEAASVNEHVLGDMENLFRQDHELRALGEIGLDFYWDRSPRDVQIRAFQDQLVLARELELPVVLHSRDAVEQTLRILEKAGFADRPLLWHCFGGGPDLAEKILAMGWRLSIPGTVTFPKNTALREAVTTIPLSRMVLETDCPFLTPHPFRGRRNEPAFMVYIAAEIAKLRGETTELIWTECSATAKTFFNLPPGDA